MYCFKTENFTPKILDKSKKHSFFQYFSCKNISFNAIYLEYIASISPLMMLQNAKNCKLIANKMIVLHKNNLDLNVDNCG